MNLEWTRRLGPVGAVAVLVADVWLLRSLALHAFGPEPIWYGLAAVVALALNASLLAVASPARAAPRSRWWIAVAGALFVVGIGARAAYPPALAMDAIPDMYRVLDIGAHRLARGEFPYVPVEAPWRTFMAYQPGILLPYTVPALLGADIRWAGVLASALVPALWVAVAGGPASLAVALAWLLEPEQRRFPAWCHDASWWPWLVGGALLHLQGRWALSGVLCGLAVASRQHVAAVVVLLACCLWHREGRAAAARFAGSALATAVLVYLPFVLVDWRAVLLEPVRYYREAIQTYVIPQRPDWIRESMGWAWWLLQRPGYYRWIVPLQGVVWALTTVAAVRWARSRSDAIVFGGLFLFVFTCLHDWPVWYLFCAPFLLITTAALHAVGRGSVPSPPVSASRRAWTSPAPCPRPG